MLPDLAFHPFRIRRIARHQNQGDRSLRLAVQLPPGPQQRIVFAGVKAAADDDDVMGTVAEPLAKRTHPTRVRRWRREVVLHVAGHVEAPRLHPEALQAPGMLLSLDGDERHGPHERRNDAAESMPPAGSRGHPAVQHDDRNVTPPQREEEIRPQVPFHDHHQAGTEAAQESIDDDGEIEGKENDAVPGEGAACSGQTGGGEGGDHERRFRKVPLQPVHQRLQQQHLSRGCPVQPDGRGCRRPPDQHRSGTGIPPSLRAVQGDR